MKRHGAEKEKVNLLGLRGADWFERRTGKEKVGEEDCQGWWQDDSLTGSNDVGAHDEQNE